MTPRAGLQLGGRYELMERIAIGGMGEVWQAADLHLDRKVAAKVLREEFTGDVGFLARMRAEARNAAGLSHTNVTAMYDYGEQDGAGFLIMEFVEGEPMSDLLTRERTLAPRQLLPIMAQTARGLHAAHVAGVVHRDVKPSNLLITRDGTVKITDFGIALGANQAPMTAAGMVMGTAQYLPPEQAMGKAAQGVGDIYALGVIAYEALVGRRPFTGPTQVDIAFAHVNQPVPALPEAVDPRVRNVVMSMLDKDPERRPRSGASLGRILDTLQRELTAEAAQARVIPRASHREDVAAQPTQAMPSAADDRDSSQLTTEPVRPPRARPPRSLSAVAATDGSSALAIEPLPGSEPQVTPKPGLRPAQEPTVQKKPVARTAINQRHWPRASEPAPSRAAGVRRPAQPVVSARTQASTVTPKRGLPQWQPLSDTARTSPASTSLGRTSFGRPRTYRHERSAGADARTSQWTLVVKVLLAVAMLTVLAIWLGTLATAQALAPAAALVSGRLRMDSISSSDRSSRRRPTSG